MVRGLVVLACAWSAACARHAYTTFRPPPSQLKQRAALAAQPAVRHRMLLAEQAIVVGAPAIAPTASVVPSAGPAEPEKLVVEVWIELQTPHVGAVAAAVRKRVEAEGGRVVSENTIGAGRRATSTALELRVAPAKHGALVDWIDGLGSVESRRILASDVGRTLVDQELALQNLGITMTRLQALAARDVPIEELLAIEKELTRVRGEIEQLQGEHRWLLDRVEYATISLTVNREPRGDLAPDEHLRPGPRVSTLVLLEGGMGSRARVGGGVFVNIMRRISFDLDVYPDASGHALTATLGTALYSSAFGHGRRRTFNPFVGVRVGYGLLADQSAMVVGGEVGLELYRSKLLLVETGARTVAFIHDQEIVGGVQGSLGVAIAF
jgi:hypothetical protein